MSQLEDRVTTKLIAKIEPNLKTMKEQIQTGVCTDLRRLVQEELALQKMGKKKQKDEADDSKGNPEEGKNDKI